MSQGELSIGSFVRSHPCGAPRPRCALVIVYESDEEDPLKALDSQSKI